MAVFVSDLCKELKKLYKEENLEFFEKKIDEALTNTEWVKSNLTIISGANHTQIQIEVNVTGILSPMQVEILRNKYEKVGWDIVHISNDNIKHANFTYADNGRWTFCFCGSIHV